MPARRSASARPKLKVVDSPPTFDEVADELYALAPEDFTAARTRYEKQARQAGDRELADRIHSLSKPSVAAWLANQLVRERREELEPLLELGASLREATRTLAGEQLRQLSRQQHALVHAVVQQARQLARAAGRSVSEDTARALEDTLHAALADEQAAQQLLAGRLRAPLQRSGFGDTTAPSDSKAPDRNRARGSQQTRGQDRLRRAEQDLTDAHRTVLDAQAARDQAATEAGRAEQAQQKAKTQLERLRQQLDETTAAAGEADRARRDRAAALRRAETALSDARRRQADARAHRDRLAADAGDG